MRMKEIRSYKIIAQKFYNILHKSETNVEQIVDIFVDILLNVTQ